MSQETTRRVHRVTALIAFTAMVFGLFFQINKVGPFRDINPFAVEPYNAVGSFAVQGTLLSGILAYARALRLRYDPAQACKTRLILRGNCLALGAILVTLVADGIAEALGQMSPSYWGNVLLGELALMFVLAFICTFALIPVGRGVQTAASSRDLTPADAIDDLWAYVRVPVSRWGAVVPRAVVEWVNGFDSDRIFARVPDLHPRTHPWRFVTASGMIVAAVLLLGQLQEGLPSSLEIGLLVTGIFIAAELGAALLGFAILGGYLGLRPSFRQDY